MNNSTLSRRQLLTGGLVVGATAVTGCLANTSGDGTGDSTERLRLTLSQDDGPLRESFVVNLSESDPEWNENAFEAALAGESYTSQYQKPFLSSSEDPTYAERGGTYYRLGSVVVDEATAIHPVLRLSAIENTTDSPSNSVAASELPTRDQQAVRVAHMAVRARGNEGGMPVGLVQRGGYVYRGDDAVEASEILAEDGPSRVRYRNTTYEVNISREAFHEPVYRATVEAVADDPEQMEAILRVQFVDAQFARKDLSSTAQDVIETAESDGYSEGHPYSSGYREVLRQLHKRPFIDGNIGKDAGVVNDGRQMVRYDGVYYDYQLRFIS